MLRRVEYDCYVLTKFRSRSDHWTWGSHDALQCRAFSLSEGGKGILYYNTDNLFCLNWIFLKSHEDLVTFSLMVSGEIDFQVTEYKHDKDASPYLNFFYDIESHDELFQSFR